MYLSMRSTGVEAEVGDKLRVTKAFGITHYGIYVGGGYVVHNHPDGGVETVTFERFANGRPVYIEARVPWAAQEAVRQAALNLIGTQFDLFNFNCEHFVTFVQTGKPESPQLRGAVVGVAVLGLLALAAGSSR